MVKRDLEPIIIDLSEQDKTKQARQALAMCARLAKSETAAHILEDLSVNVEHVGRINLSRSMRIEVETWTIYVELIDGRIIELETRIDQPYGTLGDDPWSDLP